MMESLLFSPESSYSLFLFSYLYSNGLTASIISVSRYSSSLSAASIIAPIPVSYIWMVRLDTPATSAKVPRLIPSFSLMSFSRVLFSFTYNPPGAANMNGDAFSNMWSARVSLEMIWMLNLEYTIPGSSNPELDLSPIRRGQA